MIKQIKKYGNSKVIILNQEDLLYLGVNEGDLINMVDAFKVKNKLEEAN